MVWRMSACPKCHGDLFLDEHTWVCLQCGYEGGSLVRPFYRKRIDYRTKEIRELKKRIPGGVL